MKRRPNTARALPLLLALSVSAFGADETSATLRGRVQAFDGMPILHAGVTLFPTERQQQGAKGFTDDAGRYELVGVPRGYTN